MSVQVVLWDGLSDRTVSLFPQRAEKEKAFSRTPLGRSALPSVADIASLTRVKSAPSASLSRLRKRFFFLRTLLR